MMTGMHKSIQVVKDYLKTLFTAEDSLTSIQSEKGKSRRGGEEGKGRRGRGGGKGEEERKSGKRGRSGEKGGVGRGVVNPPIFFHLVHTLPNQLHTVQNWHP